MIILLLCSQTVLDVIWYLLKDLHPRDIAGNAEEEDERLVLVQI